MTSTSIPVSNTDAPPPSIPASLRSLLSRTSTSLRHALSHRRPLAELVDRSAFSKPESLSDATARVRKNFSYFRVNYLAFLALVLALSLITHPFSLLILLLLLAAWLFLYAFRPSDQPLVVLGRTFSDRETLGILILATVVVVFLTSVGSLLISAVLIGMSVVCVHGAFRDPEDLFMDDHHQDGVGAGLFSFIGGAASSAAGPSVMSRV